MSTVIIKTALYFYFEFNCFLVFLILSSLFLREATNAIFGDTNRIFCLKRVLFVGITLSKRLFYYHVVLVISIIS